MKNLKTLSILGFIIFALSVIWEFAHHFLYVDLSGIPKYPHLLIAAFFDVVFIIGIFSLIALKNKNFDWIFSPGRNDYLAVVFLSFVVAIFIEIINLNLGRWMYTPAMPTILGVGISPLVQLALTALFSLIIFRSIKTRIN